MTIEQLLFMLGGVSISIISYFLKKTLNELEKVKVVAYETRSKVAVLENDYLNKIDRLNEKISKLNDSIDKLTEKIEKIK
jgi:peptidoglycan hydrolase CwlO-like protein